MNILKLENNLDLIKEIAQDLLNSSYGQNEETDRLLKKIIDLSCYQFQDLVTEWEDCELIKIFEILVLDKNGIKEYITFDISINEQSQAFEAQHVALTKKQEQSDKVSFVESIIDSNFSLDDNLQELYQECIEAICNSEFFTLRNEE